MIKLTNKALDEIRSMALVEFREDNNRAIESEYHVTLAYTKAVLSYLQRHGIIIEVEIPTPKMYDNHEE